MESHSAVVASTSEKPFPTRVAERYRLLEQLGTGGMGTVHRAIDETSGRAVAFKQLVSSMAGARRKTAEALFEREYHTLVRLKHPRIIEVYDYGLTETGPYYTMELLDGTDLNQLGKMPYQRACGHLRDIASSLALIHAHRLIHRDVSARNIRLTEDGRAKLIDFGALAPFGMAEDIVGTPLCMAPEVLHRTPLDQRIDIYALGAVAYWALTGQHAYPARRLSDLNRAWEQAPIPPGVLVPELPRALEVLVLSLLSLDPLGRPPSAAAVIDQLTAIAGLEPEEHEHAAQSYLLSTRMVGRTTELTWVGRRVERALAGRGAEVVIEGGAGIGKTRLLHEAALGAQLKGALTLEVDAQAFSEPFGVATALALRLLDASPEIGRRAAGERIALLSHLSPLLREKFGHVDLVAIPADAAERRARFHSALHEWFLEVLRTRMLIIAVDNVHAADDDSAAFLAALGRESRRTRLVLIMTQRTGDPLVAAAPIRMLRERSSHLKLAGLNGESCEQLVRSLFGDVPNTGRIASLLLERSAGVPQQCMDLVQILVGKKIAKYYAGTWVLPQDVATDELPSQAEEILANRLAGLSPAARTLAETLSIHMRPVPLHRCLALAEGQSESETYAALDELVVEQILVTDRDSYRFAHGALREALLGRMAEARRRAQHARVADALLAAEPERVATRVEAAVHLFDAGAESRGAEIMAKLGWGLTNAPDFNAGREAAVALSRALEVFERQGRSEYELAAVLFPMMKLAYYSPHWRLILEHGERALEIGLRITGLAHAEGLRPELGRELALAEGLKVASAAFAEQQRLGLGYDLRTAIIACCGIIPSVVGIIATCLDTERVARLKGIAEPLTLFGSEHVAGIMYEWIPYQILTNHGRSGEARMKLDEDIRMNLRPAVREALGEASWKSQFGGLLLGRGMYDAYGFGDGALRAASELEALGIRVWAMGADQIRLLYHACRGEADEVAALRERVELFAIQGSTTWQVEMFWPVVLLNSDVLTGDALAARRTSQQLARRAKDIQSLQKYADLAQAAYLTLRGELSSAIELYERVLPQFPLRQRVAYQAARSYFAQALNFAGRHARAKELVLEVISGMVEADHRIAVHFLEPQRQLALAEAGLGNVDEAVRILDALLAKHGHEDNPLLVGLLHKARAEVALAVRDEAELERHLAEMEKRFRRTRSPALIAEWERLADRVERTGLFGTRRVAGKPGSSTRRMESVTLRNLDELSAAAAPCEYALALMLQESKATSGFLYVYRHGTMQLAAACGPARPPPRELQGTLAQLAEGALVETVCGLTHTPDASPDATSGTVRELTASDETMGPEPTCESPAAGDAMDDCNTVFVKSVPPPNLYGPYQLVLLETQQAASRVVIGGVILEASAQQIGAFDAGLLRWISRVLFDRRVMTMDLSSVDGFNHPEQGRR